MELRADGLMLREPVDADAPGMAASVRASLPELQPWMPWAVPDYDEATALKWIRGEFGDEYRFVMMDDSGTHVGSCGLNSVDSLNKSANLGYWVRSDFAGRGFATTATRLLVQFGFSETDLHRLEVTMSVRNEASRRVADKAGAHYEGMLRGALLLQGEFHDTYLFSFTREVE